MGLLRCQFLSPGHLLEPHSHVGGCPHPPTAAPAPTQNTCERTHWVINQSRLIDPDTSLPRAHTARANTTQHQHPGGKASAPKRSEPSAPALSSPRAAASLEAVLHQQPVLPLFRVAVLTQVHHSCPHHLHQGRGIQGGPQVPQARPAAALRTVPHTSTAAGSAGTQDPTCSGCCSRALASGSGNRRRCLAGSSSACRGRAAAGRRVCDAAPLEAVTCTWCSCSSSRSSG